MSNAHGYSGTPLPRKLGVTGESRVLVVDAPPGFELGAPHHVRAGRDGYDVQLVFCSDAAALRRRWETAVRRSTERGAVWVAWPKKSSGVAGLHHGVGRVVRSRRARRLPAAPPATSPVFH